MIGDCLLITPALSLLKQKYPEARISALARSYTKDIFLNNPNIEEIIEDGPAFNRQFDCSIHFYNEFPYALRAKLAGIKYRVGDSSKPFLRPFYNLSSNCRWNDLTLHEVEHNILLLKPLGIDLPEIPPPLQINAPLNANKNLNLNPSDLVVGIHIGTGKGNKAWLPKRYAEVIDYLIENLKAKVIITGSRKETISAAEIMRLCKNKPLDLVNKTNLAELIALISRFSLYIGADTGPLHIAAALKIPLVALFPTKFVKPTEWGPWQTPHVIIRKSVNCSQKCLPKNCPFDDCLKEISVEDVMEGVKTLLSGGGNRTLREARSDWFKKSLNVLTNKEEIQRELSLSGYHAVNIGFPDELFGLISQMIKEDINVIHWVGHKHPFLLPLANLFATPTRPMPHHQIFLK